MRTSGTMFTSIFGIAVIKQVPPLRVSIIAGASSSAGSTLGVSTTRSAITPAVISWTSGMASSAEAAVSVAPKNFAESRLNSTGSTAMTALAPAARAPCTALIPTPPVPMITTVSPGCVPTPTVAEPQPVVTPHDTSEAASNGIDSSILMTDSSARTAYSANVPSCVIAVRSSPPTWRRDVPSVTMFLSRIMAPLSHRYVMPDTHHRHLTTRRNERERDTVARPHRPNTRTDFLDEACAFVAAEHRKQIRNGAAHRLDHRAELIRHGTVAGDE